MCRASAWNREFGKSSVPGVLENVPFVVATWLIIVSERAVLPVGYTCALSNDLR